MLKKKKSWAFIKSKCVPSKQENPTRITEARLAAGFNCQQLLTNIMKVMSCNDSLRCKLGQAYFRTHLCDDLTSGP